MALSDDTNRVSQPEPSQAGDKVNSISAEFDHVDILGLIGAVCDKFDQYYVFPEVAAKMRSYMFSKLQDGRYQGFDNLESLTSQMNRDLREISEDGHVAVYPSGLFSFLPTEGGTLSDSEKKKAARRNYGFVEVRRLAGNIGYLKFNYFTYPSIAAPTASAAIQFLANTDAAIIDLRDNSGGEEAMVQFLLAYFFEDQKHLLNVYGSKNELIEQSWTCANVPGNKMCETALFVLTSNRTGSGAEDFAFALQCLKRATLVGETTQGIAHRPKIFDLTGYGVRIHVPYARPVNPVTNTSWEKSGVKPDIEVADDQALTVAHVEAMRQLLNTAIDDEMRHDLEWALPVVQAQSNPMVLSEPEQKKYTGIYDDGKYSIIVKNGRLCWRYTPTIDYGLNPISADLFGFDDTEDDRLQFVRNIDRDVIGFQVIRRSGGEPVLRHKTGEL